MTLHSPRFTFNPAATLQTPKTRPTPTLTESLNTLPPWLVVVQISPSLALKMKRQEAVVQTMGRPATKPSPSAREINVQTFQRALSKVSPDQRQRYEKYGA